jgi:topoisomerase-4 subunit A|tara:strand:- start:143445 stop:145682 length:2238 start_codon:yes stop_codon:yes gene_type:complete
MNNSIENDELSIVDEPMSKVLSERYLSYALSTIVSRSLPDVRDGMKPVHRRVLYAMYRLRLRPELQPKKSARVVGDVIGQYHPHGDQSVYDAMVRLAQDFSLRYPLVDGQGNFGNIDGDNAAAMRYTEARLTDTAIRMLQGIDEDAVDYRFTYDGETKEPAVLPAAFPNLLANGSSGIAVGMATSIPPHNVAELCEAMLLMLKKDASIAEICEHVQGPDFPTGGILVEDKAAIVKAYETGRGSFRVRARWEKEELKQGLYQIVVTEIPYQVQKARLIEKIADLIHSKKLPLLDDVRDESAEDIRLVLVPKNRNVEPELLMEALFRHSDLESRASLNMNVLENGVSPRVMNIKEVLREFLNHRQSVLVRRASNRLDKVMTRIEILEGYLIVYLNIDEVIRIIRESDEPRPELMKAFGLTEVQAEAVLNMKLRSLRKLEEIEMRTEHDGLCAERDALKGLIGSESEQWKEIKKEVLDLKKTYGLNTAIGRRYTDIGCAPAPVALEDLDQAMIEKEPITIVYSDKGWIRAMKGHNVVTKDLKFKDGDSLHLTLEAQTTDKILVYASNGRFYTIGGDKLPSGRGFGEPVRLMQDIPNDVDLVDLIVYKPDTKYVLASTDGRGFIVNSNDLLASTRGGKVVLNCKDPVKALVCNEVGENDDSVAVMGENRKMLIFNMDEMPEMAKGKGVIIQRYKDGGLSDIKTFNAEEKLRYRYGTGETALDDTLPWIGKRAGAGRLPPNGFPKNNKFN